MALGLLSPMQSRALVLLAAACECCGCMDPALPSQDPVQGLGWACARWQCLRSCPAALQPGSIFCSVQIISWLRNAGRVIPDSARVHPYRSCCGVF